MTPAEALELLDRMAAATPATRVDHITAQQATEVLRQLIAGGERATSPAETTR